MLHTILVASKVVNEIKRLKKWYVVFKEDYAKTYTTL